MINIITESVPTCTRGWLYVKQSRGVGVIMSSVCLVLHLAIDYPLVGSAGSCLRTIPTLLISSLLLVSPVMATSELESGALLAPPLGVPPSL